MQGFGLLLGHLVGDYIVQNDWMAKWKTAEDGTATPEEHERITNAYGDHRKAILQDSWAQSRPTYACTVHCLLYTLSVWAFSFWWMPWWGLLVCFAVHWPVDRFRLARKWMENVSGQKDFANGMFSPWSIIIVDNVFHLLTLWTIAVLAAL